MVGSRFADELRLLNESIAALENATQSQDILHTLQYQVGVGV